jgi:hypothetical protein
MPGRPLSALCSALLASAILLVVSCTASAPSDVDGSFLPLPDGMAGYAAFAICTPPTACPGADCASNVVGKADGKHLDLSSCSPLDIFMGWDRVLGVTLHLGAAITDKLPGGLLIEVSSLGTDYVPGGSINWLSKDNKDPCSPKISGQRVAFESWCGITHPAYEVRHLRLTTKELKAGVLLLDAVELLTP